MNWGTNPPCEFIFNWSSGCWCTWFCAGVVSFQRDVLNCFKVFCNCHLHKVTKYDHLTLKSTEWHWSCKTLSCGFTWCCCAWCMAFWFWIWKQRVKHTDKGVYNLITNLSQVLHGELLNKELLLQESLLLLESGLHLLSVHWFLDLVHLLHLLTKNLLAKQSDYNYVMECASIVLQKYSMFS